MANKQLSTKPKRLQYTIYTIGSKIKCLQHKIKIDRKGLIEFEKNRPDKKDGYVIIYNHACDYDHWASTAMLNHRLANYVLAKYFSFNHTLRPLLESVKCIYKDQFVADLGSIRQMKRASERPGIVCIAPAGQMSGDGGEQFISRSIVKLLRFINKDVVAIVLNGGHLKKPKWATKENTRKSFKLDAHTYTVLRKDQIPHLTDDELYNLVLKYCNYNCYDWQKQHMQVIKGDHLAEGLENLLFMCPKCGKKHTNITNGNKMICANCGNTIIYNKYGFLEPKSESDVCFEDEHKWNVYQKEVLKEHLRNHDLEELIIPCRMKRNYRADNELEECGEGYIHLGDGFLYYEGTFNNESYSKNFPYDSIFLIPHGLGRSFYCPDSEGSFEFWPTERLSVVNEVVLRIDAKRDLAIEEGLDI